jgi:phosphohistidine phosphatase SixA
MNVVLVSFLMAFAGFAHAAGEQARVAPDTISAEQLQDMGADLRRGGYVFYLRHAVTRLDQEDRQPVVLDDCATQRNLSDEGKRQARAIGAAFQKMRIPVGKVLASPFCRTLETARMVFGKAVADDDLYFAIGLGKPEREAKGAALRRMLAQQPAPGSNVVLVAHTANLEEAVGFWPKPEGTIILFQPDGNGGFRVIGRIPPESWPGVPAVQPAPKP